MEKFYDDLIKQLIEIGRSEIIPPSTEMNIRLRESREQISPSININNYIWRTILKWSDELYNSQQIKERNLIIFRESILKKIKTDK